MRVWTVHTPPSPGRSLDSGLPVLVPERFAWLAFLLGLPWLMWHRLWLAALIYGGAVAILLALVPAFALAPAGIALHLLLGAHAQDLRRAALTSRGYRQVQVVAEQDADRALARVLA